MSEDYDLLDFLYNAFKRKCEFQSAVEIHNLLLDETKIV